MSKPSRDKIHEIWRGLVFRSSAVATASASAWVPARYDLVSPLWYVTLTPIRQEWHDFYSRNFKAQPAAPRISHSLAKRNWIRDRGVLVSKVQLVVTRFGRKVTTFADLAEIT